MVLFPDRIIKDKEKTTIFVYKGFCVETLEAEAGVRNAISAFCTRNGDAYLKKLLEESEKADIGTITIGFDIKNRENKNGSTKIKFLFLVAKKPQVTCG